MRPKIRDASEVVTLRTTHESGLKKQSFEFRKGFFQHLFKETPILPQVSIILAS